MFDLFKNQLYLYRDVQFLEDTYPYNNIFFKLKIQQSTDITRKNCSDVPLVTNKPWSFNSRHLFLDSLPIHSPMPNSMSARSESVSTASGNSYILSFT